MELPASIYFVIKAEINRCGLFIDFIEVYDTKEEKESTANITWLNPPYDEGIFAVEVLIMRISNSIISPQKVLCFGEPVDWWIGF